MTFHIAPYSEAWPRNFVEIQSQLRLIFIEPSIEIEHIGSTAVPGLCAKPVIDVLVGAHSLARIEAGIANLAAAGYAYISKYELEIPMRRYFVKPESELPRVHIHAVRKDSEIWNAHLGFRELLRADAKKREAYAQLKLELASLHKDDKAAYTEAKAPFIMQMLAGLTTRS
jgi:GrpB-like predicted nucleotidyltransferase (UPF0157 family)